MKKLIVLLLSVWLFASSGDKTTDTEELTIASEQIDCVGVGPQKCLLIKRDGSDSWEYWYSGIEDFEYEPGYEYVILITKETDENPPADRSTVRYKLHKIVSKEKKSSENMPKRRS
ncbi:MAG: DUF4377 domain-containing protein [Rikenellaceae bacterium]|nr:DUF4377 domain-containing protein [Rikenellaceae bacterium]